VQERTLVEFIKETESLRELWRDSDRRALSWCAERAHEKNLLSSGIEKSPGQDLHRVSEHPAGSTRSFWSKRLPRRHQILHLREKKGLIPLEV
jgi:hypothetical protein